MKNALISQGICFLICKLVNFFKDTNYGLSKRDLLFNYNYRHNPLHWHNPQGL